jgi:hypothetical protein
MIKFLKNMRRILNNLNKNKKKEVIIELIKYFIRKNSTNIKN